VRKHRTNKSKLYFRAIDCCNQFHARLQFLCYTEQRYRNCACKNRLNRVVCCVLLGILPSWRERNFGKTASRFAYEPTKIPTVLRQHIVFISGTRQNCVSLSFSLSQTTYWYSSRRVRRVEKIARRAGPSKPRVSTKQITERQAGMRLGVCGRNVHFEEPRTSSRKTSLR